MVDSFDFNPHKQLRVAFDCSALWLRNRHQLVAAMEAHAAYLTPAAGSAPSHVSADQQLPPAAPVAASSDSPAAEPSGIAAHPVTASLPSAPQPATSTPPTPPTATPPTAPAPWDLRNWQLPLGRRFRALKLWCVLRGHGLARLRAELQSQVASAALLAGLARADDRWVVVCAALGLVGLRVRTGDEATKAVETAAHAAGYHLSHSTVGSHYFLRISFAQMPAQEDVRALWAVLCAQL